MECALVSDLPEGSDWSYEVKLDGYRAIGVRTSETILYSRNHKNFNKRFPQIAEALDDLPADTVIDGEVVALDESGRPDFHGLQHFTAEASRIRYFVFDLLVLNGRHLTSLPLIERRKLLAGIKIRSSCICISEQFNISAADMVSAVRQQGLEGVVAKRKTSIYEEGKRTGSWAKMRINKGQEFVVGGFFPGPHGIDSIVIGYYRGKDLIYVARTRNGFVPASRRMVYGQLKPLIIAKCPFVNLPETGRARWGEILDAEKMKKCVWVRPKLVAVIEFRFSSLVISTFRTQPSRSMLLRTWLSRFLSRGTSVESPVMLRNVKLPRTNALRTAFSSSVAFFLVVEVKNMANLPLDSPGSASVSLATIGSTSLFICFTSFLVAFVSFKIRSDIVLIKALDETAATRQNPNRIKSFAGSAGIVEFPLIESMRLLEIIFRKTGTANDATRPPRKLRHALFSGSSFFNKA